MGTGRLGTQNASCQAVKIRVAWLGDILPRGGWNPLYALVTGLRGRRMVRLDTPATPLWPGKKPSVRGFSVRGSRSVHEPKPVRRLGWATQAAGMGTQAHRARTGGLWPEEVGLGTGGGKGAPVAFSILGFSSDLAGRWRCRWPSWGNTRSPTPNSSAPHPALLPVPPRIRGTKRA